MKLLPQPPPDPLPPHEPAGAVAKAALFFSLVACALSGFAVLCVYEDGKYVEVLKENLGGLRAKAGEMIAGSKGAARGGKGAGEDASGSKAAADDLVASSASASKSPTAKVSSKSDAKRAVRLPDEAAGALDAALAEGERALVEVGEKGAEAVARAAGGAAGPATDAPTPWDRIREAVVEVRDTIASGDGGRARARLEELREQVARLQSEAGERGGEALESTRKALEDAYRKFDESRAAASERLKELQLDLAPLARRVLESAVAEEDSATPAEGAPSPAVRLSEADVEAESAGANSN